MHGLQEIVAMNNGRSDEPMRKGVPYARKGVMRRLAEQEIEDTTARDARRVKLSQGPSDKPVPLEDKPAEFTVFGIPMKRVA